jgi:1,4-alpha-glucan branching enzyme
VTSARGPDRDAGEFALVLHTHLPYVAHHGVWPVGEEWLFQAWGESWLPVTEVLLRLAEDGHGDVVSLSVSPTVAHQLAEPRLRREMGSWLGAQMWQSEEQRLSYRGRDREAIRRLGRFHWRRYAALLEAYERVEASGGLLMVWAELADRGVIELLGGPATHPYLPLMDDPGLLDAQLVVGLDSHAVWAGDRPDGLWAPECGYRPAGTVADPTVAPLHVDGHGTPTLARGGVEVAGLEEHYAAVGVSHFVVDAPTLIRAARGGEADWTRRPTVATPGSPEDSVHDGVLVGDSDVVAFARDLSVAYHVWSPQSGYPGDPWYRDFHARGYFGSHPSWRVTDKQLGSAEKLPYEPERAAERVSAHADHLHAVLHEVLDPRPGGLVVAAYDTELLGHWWLEGPSWLETFLRGLADDPALRTTTLGSRRRRRPPTRRLALPESSWGYAKGHGAWVQEATRPMWRELRRAEETFRRVGVLVRGRRSSGGDALYHQAARELACAQASDWPYMVNRGDCPGYARDRLAGHVARLDRIERALRTEGERDLAALADGLRATVDAPRDPDPFLATPGAAPLRATTSG